MSNVLLLTFPMHKLKFASNHYQTSQSREELKFEAFEGKAHTRVRVQLQTCYFGMQINMWCIEI